MDGQRPRARTRAHPGSDTLALEDERARCSGLVGWPGPFGDERSVGDADRGEAERGAEMEGEARTPWVIAPRRVDEQHVRPGPEHLDRPREQRALTQREETGLVGGTGLPSHDGDLAVDRRGRPRPVSRVPRPVLAAHEAGEAAAHAGLRPEGEGLLGSGRELALELAQRFGCRRPPDHVSIVPRPAPSDRRLEECYTVRRRWRVRDEECVPFLQWALPRLGLSWSGFRKVRRQVCRRISRRMDELGIADAVSYRSHLEEHSDEWAHLDRLCRITISRFWRDRAVFDALRDVVLPALGPTTRCWSAGCASGEEPYSLVLAAAEAEVAVEVLATDVDPVLLERARRACYEGSSLRDLPADTRAAAFEDGCLRPEHREHVSFRLHDVRVGPPPGSFDLVLCRNLAFTYFAKSSQRSVSASLHASLRPGGALVVGSHEAPPAGAFEPWLPGLGVWRRPVEPSPLPPDHPIGVEKSAPSADNPPVRAR